MRRAVSTRVAAWGRGVVLAYGARSVLAASDFELPAGMVTAVIGPNGAGKSTFLDALVGLIPATAGEIEVLGEAPRAARRHVSYVMQLPKMNERMPVTVREVVAMSRYARLGILRRFGREDRDAVERSLRLLDIADLADRHLGELSGGQRQRVLVAQGFAQDSALVLLDEPLTGLDLVSAERILETVAAFREEGRTVVVTTHDLSEAQGADHVVLLAGRVVAAGPPGVVLTSGNLAHAYGAGLLRLAEGNLALDDPHHTPHGPQHHPPHHGPHR